jgi:hypothetical protein
MKLRRRCTLKKVCVHYVSVERICRQTHFRTGLQNLRRYFGLIIFQAYLQSTIPDTMQSFESIETFVKNRPGVFILVRYILSFDS